MADGTKIEWTDATVNYVNGCTVYSPGCTNCYAMRLAGTRLKHHPSREGLTTDTKAGPVWNGTVRPNEKALLQPLSWRRARMLFWNAHGDLFHESVPDEWIDRQFAVMALTPQHRHQVLTKRSARMRAYVTELRESSRWLMWEHPINGHTLFDPMVAQYDVMFANVWLGVSVEDQTRADERIPDLLATPAAVRWLSCEPLLGPVDLTDISGVEKSREYGSPVHGWSAIWRNNGLGRAWIDWVVLGGESGPGARPMHPAWARAIRDDCAAYDIPFLFKQWGEWKPLSENGGGFWPTNEGGCCRMDAAGDYTQAGWPFQRIGKKAAGRILDGVQHDGYPA